MKMNVQLVLIFLTTLLFIHYIWKKRWLYYHSLGVSGPFSLPVIGSVLYILRMYLLMGGSKDIYNIIYEIVDKYQPYFCLWFLDQLYFFTTRSEDLEIVLTSCLEKSDIYNFSSEFLKNTLVQAPLDLWKKTRKIVIRTFSTSFINSFIEIFATHGNHLVKELEKVQGPIDMFHKMWLMNIGITCETLANVDLNLVRGFEDYIHATLKGEEITTERICNPFLHPDIVWKSSTIGKEATKYKASREGFIQQLYDVIKNHNAEESSKKYFLQHLHDSYKEEKYSEADLLTQGNFLFFTASETTATTMSYVLFLLGLHLNIQDKVLEEISAVFKGNDKNTTLEDISQLEYLERVIKETMRLFPAVPLVARFIDRDIKLDSYTLPAGSNLMIPIGYIHRKKEYWPEPLKFDPDRFLPEEVAKRPKYSYLPFSCGPRNCLGYRYAMVSMKVILSTLLRSFKVKASNYNRVEDVDFVYHILARPKNGLFIELEKYQFE